MDGTFLTFVHLVCCIVLLILSFVVIAPIAVVVRNFDNHCFIGAHLTNNSAGRVVAEDIKGSGAPCVYPEFMGFIALFFSIAYMIWNGCLLFNSIQSTWRDSFIGSVISMSVSLMMLISSAMLSSGLNKLCKTLGRGIHRCETVTYQADSTWFDYKDISGNIIPNSHIHVSSFYSLFKTAEVGSWLCFVVFIIIVITYWLKLKHSGEGASFVENLNRERERIVDRTNQRRYDQI